MQLSVPLALLKAPLEVISVFSLIYPDAPAILKKRAQSIFADFEDISEP